MWLERLVFLCPAGPKSDQPVDNGLIAELGASLVFADRGHQYVEIAERGVADIVDVLIDVLPFGTFENEGEAFGTLRLPLCRCVNADQRNDLMAVRLREQIELGPDQSFEIGLVEICDRIEGIPSAKMASGTANGSTHFPELPCSYLR